MDKRIYVLNNEGQPVGYARIGQDDTGKLIGEVYDTEANKLGAIRFEPLAYKAGISLIYNHEGAQIGYARLQASEDEEEISAKIYMLAQPNTTDLVVPTLREEPLLKQEVDERSQVLPEEEEIEDQVVAYLSYSSEDSGRVKVMENGPGGEKIGSLRSEDVEDRDRLILIGGGAALLLLV